MGAGNRRDLVTFQRQTPQEDGYGNSVSGEFVDHHTEWADVLERTGGEKLAAGAVMSTRFATIRVLSTSETRALTTADIVLARDTTWNIRAVAAVGRNGHLLEFACESGVAV